MKNKSRRCLSCKDPIEGHFNRKRCPDCVLRLKKCPLGRLTPDQEKKVRKLAGTMKIKDLAKVVGTSDSTLDRWAKHNNFDINWLKYKPDEIRAVCASYELHGKVKTQKMFPKLNVRSIVEKHKIFEPRQTKWTDQQMIELVKMAGLVSPTGQQRFFKRPNSFEGGIKSVWIKRFGLKQTSIHGMPHWTAKHLVNSNARYIQPFGISRSGKKVKFRRVILWTEMEKCLKPEVPDFICEAIKSMAQFQRTLFGVKDPKKKIIKMITEREK